MAKKKKLSQRDIRHLVPRPNACACGWNVQLVQGHEPGCRETAIPAPLVGGELPLVQAVTTDQGCHVMLGGRDIVTGVRLDI